MKKELDLKLNIKQDSCVRDRIKAALLYDKGWSFAQIAEALLLSDDAVRHHLNEYKAWNKLKPGPFNCEVH